MTKIKLKNIELLQLAGFLENRPPKDFAKTSDWRKVTAGGEAIRKGLGEYYLTFVELESKVGAFEAQHEKEVFALIAEAGDIIERNGNLFTVKEKLTPVEEKRKDKYLKSMKSLQEKKAKNPDHKKALEDFENFQKSMNETETEIELGNPEYNLAMKNEVEEFGTKYDKWLNHMVLAHISEAVDKL